MDIITSDRVKFIFDIIYKRSGISLTENKLYLLQSRLLPVAQQNKFSSINDLIDKIKLNNNSSLVNEVIDAMTTNESLFFRDKTPFIVLKERIIPELLKKNKSAKIRIWCAACSTGQEPYSILMTLYENFSKYMDNFEVLATDISPTVIEKAKTGKYSQFEVQRGVPVKQLLSYFEQHDKDWVIKSNFRNKVTFKVFNLFDSLSSLGKFDIIFCRNVLIYFTKDDKKKLLSNLHNVIKDNGILILGSSEMVMNNKEQYQLYEKGGSGIYKKIV